ncbi:MAG: EamA family transporter [Planctomycetota bacterium]
MSLCSAILLGLYDAAKKHSVRDNAVPPVLLAAVVCAAILWCIGLFAGRTIPVLSGTFVDIAPLSWSTHFAIACKSAIVAASWTLAYFALRELPLSIAAPLRATGPIWTIALATTFLGERPAPLQWLGVLVVLAAFFRFSTIGKWEGIEFRRSRAVGWMIAATLVGALSGLYDKILLQRVGLRAAELQCWFSIDLVPMMLPGWWYWWRYDRVKRPFAWRRSIPLIAILLLIADYAYFTALEDPAAMVALVSPIRRVAVMVSLGIGWWHFGEANGRAKLLAAMALLVGIGMIAAGA